MSNTTTWKLAPINSNSQSATTVNRLNSLFKLTENLLNDNAKFYTEEGKSFQQVIHSLNQLLEDSNKFIVSQNLQRQKVIGEQDAIQKQIVQNDIDQKKFTEEQAATVQEIESIKKHIKELNTLREDIIKKLDWKVVKSVSIDKLSEVNQLFVWFIRVIYKESSAVYYWPNFKEQIFGKDNGADFLLRLAKTRAIDMTNEEGVLTESLLDKKESIIQNEALNEKQIQHVNVLFEIIDNYQNCYKDGLSVKALKEKEDSLRVKIVEKEIEGERIQQKQKALLDRIAEFEASQKQLQSLHKMLEEKSASYQKLAVENFEYLTSVEKHIITLNPAVAANFTVLEKVTFDEQIVDNKQYNEPQVAAPTPLKESEIKSSSVDKEQKEESVNEPINSERSETNKEKVGSPQKYQARFIEPPSEIRQAQPTASCSTCSIF